MTNATHQYPKELKRKKELIEKNREYVLSKNEKDELEDLREFLKINVGNKKTQISEGANFSDQNIITTKEELSGKLKQKAQEIKCAASSKIRFQISDFINNGKITQEFVNTLYKKFRLIVCDSLVNATTKEKPTEVKNNNIFIKPMTKIKKPKLKLNLEPVQRVVNVKINDKGRCVKTNLPTKQNIKNVHEFIKSELKLNKSRKMIIAQLLINTDLSKDYSHTTLNQLITRYEKEIFM